ncbi:unnamed protein product [Agarophyton chilense]
MKPTSEFYTDNKPQVKQTQTAVKVKTQQSSTQPNAFRPLQIPPHSQSVQKNGKNARKHNRQQTDLPLSNSFHRPRTVPVHHEGKKERKAYFQGLQSQKIMGLELAGRKRRFYCR